MTGGTGILFIVVAFSINKFSKHVSTERHSCMTAQLCVDLEDEVKVVGHGWDWGTVEGGI